jgi:DNA-binding transcriptional regulator PaaX
MPSEATAEAIAYLLAQDVFVVAYIDEVLHIAHKRPELDLYLSYHPEGAEVRVCDDLQAVVHAHAPTKLLFVAQPHEVRPILDALYAIVGSRLVTTQSHALFGELTALGVNKGVALAELARQLWDLPEWSKTGHRLLREMDAARGIPGRFVIAAAMVRHLLTDPVLPAELLPADWPGDSVRFAYADFADLLTSRRDAELLEAK